MDVRHLNRLQARESSPFEVGLNFQYEPCTLAEAVVHTRAIRMLESKAPLYPIHRKVRAASRRTLVEVFDDLALHMNMSALRLDETTLLLDEARRIHRGRRHSQARLLLL